MPFSTIPRGARIGSYEVLEQIGAGGVATVYRARHGFLDRQVALKILHRHWTEAPEFIERFREEGRLLALLEHPNILRVHDAGEADGVFFLATAYLDGWPLSTLLKKDIPAEAALSITGQLLRALAYAHSRGVVHRDVKPANLMVSPQGQVTLTDLGVARLIDAPSMTLPGMRVGTPYYMAPEQIRGEPVDGRADLYATGIILFQMLAGWLPFPGPTTEEVYQGHLRREAPELPEGQPEWLRALVARALAKRPEERFGSAEELLGTLLARGAGVQRPTTAPPVHTPGATAARTQSGTAEDADGAATTVVKKEDRAVLSLDVVDSTRMKLPGLTTAIQNQFGHFRRYVSDHLKGNRCLVHVWAGDGLLALFSRASDAAACAAGILGGLPEFNNAHRPGKQPLRVRVGVHYGPVQMTDGQPLGEVISRTLDYAGHLQKVCPADAALISESVYFALPDVSRWEPAGDAYALVFPFPVFKYADGSAAAAQASPPAAPSTEPGVLHLRYRCGEEEREYRLTGVTLVGRQDPAASSAPGIEVIGDPAVSRRHLRFLPAGGWCVEDLDSANGTEVNGEPLQPFSPRTIQAGDEIRLGEHAAFRVEQSG